MWTQLGGPMYQSINQSTNYMQFNQNKYIYVERLLIYLFWSSCKWLTLKYHVDLIHHRCHIWSFFFLHFYFPFSFFLCAKHHGFNTIKQIDHRFNNCWRGLYKLWSIPHKHTPSPLRVIRFMWKPPKPHPYVEWIDPICIGTIWDVRTSKLRVFLDFPSGCGGSPKVAMFWFLSCNRFPIFVQKKEREREREI